MLDPTPTELVAACQNGDRRAASRLISLLESSDRAVAELASAAIARLPLPRQTIGVTGPPGAGKSTLLDYVVPLYRSRGEKVAVLAIDPSSPFTGGALLGDRIRMASLRNDAGVFIRSMGSRGASGGIASAASDALRVLAASGYSTVFLEAIGAGQTEIEIAHLADTVVVVQVPGLGDDVQLMKMGILEIADVFVVNKGDKPDAAGVKLQLEMALAENHGETCRALRQLGKDFSRAFAGPHWIPLVVLVSALKRENGAEMMAACDRHLAYLRQPALDSALRHSRLARELAWRTARRIQDRLAAELAVGGAKADVVGECLDGRLSIEQAVERLAFPSPPRGEGRREP